jgi:hypothetical protein
VAINTENILDGKEADRELGHQHLKKNRKGKKGRRDLK